MKEQQRKFIFFLGAGASLGAGACAVIQGGNTLPIPTQSSFWDVFIRFCVSKNNRKTIESFLFTYFLGYSRVPAKLSAAKRRELLSAVDVEEVFTFLSERAQAPATTPSMRTYTKKVWLALVEEIQNVFGHFKANTKTRNLYRLLLKNHIRSWDSVVSFNYDTIFEHSLPKRQSWHYSAVSKDSDGLRILKPHGSINWEDSSPIKIVKDPKRALVVAPTHLKFIQTTSVSATADSTTEDSEADTGYLDHAEGLTNVWSNMEEEMKAAKVLVFIGYSFPVADLYFSSVLRSVLADRGGAPGLVIVNPDAVAIRNRLTSRFPLAKVNVYFDLLSFCQSSRKNVAEHFS
jgi:hypothetical protein